MEISSGSQIDAFMDSTCEVTDSGVGLDEALESVRSLEEGNGSFTDSDLDTTHPVRPERKSKQHQKLSQDTTDKEKNSKEFHVLIVRDENSKCVNQNTTESQKAMTKVLPDVNAAKLEINRPVTVTVNDCEHNNNFKVGEFVSSSNHPERDYFIRLLQEGQYESTDFKVSLDDRPVWLDEEKYKRGQAFAQKYIFCINFAEMCSLLMIFAIKVALAPLIFTKRSHTPFKAFQRYLSTTMRLKTWYEDDIWNNKECSARKNMAVVKAMHRSVYKKLSETSDVEMEQKVTLGDEHTTALWCPMKTLLLDDFRGSCPMALPGSNPYEGGRSVWINQLDMAATQFTFVGLVVTFPQKFGIHGACDEDLEAFLHMWKGLGYLLGIRDTYNFCNGDLDAVRSRTRTFIDVAIKPAFRDVTSDWEHMCRCLVQGIAFYLPGVSFEVSLKFLTDALNIYMPRLTKSFTILQYIHLLFVKFTFNYMFRISYYLDWSTRLLKRSLKMAEEASPEKLSNWEKRKFSFMVQANKRSVDQ